MHTAKAGMPFTVGCAIILLSIFSACANKEPGKPLEITPAAQSDSSAPAAARPAVAMSTVVATPASSAAPASSSAAVADDTAVLDTHDPLEPVNRGLFKVHEVIDGVLLKPIAHIYLGVMPEAGQHGLSNALTNLSSPVVLLNSVLQWDMPNAGRTVERFAINSTVGVAGFFDVASTWGIPRQHSKDFGQTMGVYGVGTGPYIFIPILGPSDARDTLGMVADFFSDPFVYVLNNNAEIALDVARGIVKRADYIPLTDRIERDSFDPYVSYRSIYLQNRKKVVDDYLGSDSAIEK
jgi:phospholipid-binding lipoprotein MlaA